MKKKLFILLLLVLSIVSGSSVVYAQSGDLPPVESPQAFLSWLALGSAPLIGVLTSLLERKSKWFQDLSSKGKWWVSFGLGAGIPATAGLLLLYVPVSFWEAITPVFYIVGMAIFGYLGKEIAYLLLVKPNEVK